MFVLFYADGECREGLLVSRTTYYSVRSRIGDHDAKSCERITIEDKTDSTFMVKSTASPGTSISLLVYIDTIFIYLFILLILLFGEFYVMELKIGM